MGKVLEEETKRVICVSCHCVSCHKEVEVELVPYGNGHIATCPVCKKLAYNGK